MVLQRPQDIFDLPYGAEVPKGVLSELIQQSKIPGSSSWGGPDFAIGNTPQQGINWIGRPPYVNAVLLKSRSGEYEHEGWIDGARSAFKYSFKARNGVVDYREVANKVLIEQPRFGYPIFLFSKLKSNWKLEGEFTVGTIDQLFVVLTRQGSRSQLTTSPDEILFSEGNLRYSEHLLAERNKDVIEFLKQRMSPLCDICGEDFRIRYGVSYAEAHHKIPLAAQKFEHNVTINDFALLCPNCHKAVHIYMKSENADYLTIKTMLRLRFGEAESL